MLGRLLCLLPILLSVAGCADYFARVQAYKAAQEDAIASADDAHCRSLGNVPGTKPYDRCRYTTEKSRLEADESQRAAWLGVAQVGAQMMATPPPPAPPGPLQGDPVCVDVNNKLYRC
jgi:hypothetical protein